MAVATATVLFLVPFQWFAVSLLSYSSASCSTHLFLLAFGLVLGMLSLEDGKVVPFFSSPVLNEHIRYYHSVYRGVGSRQDLVTAQAGLEGHHPALTPKH